MCPTFAGVLQLKSALRLGDAIYESDGLIWSSPLYHGTVSVSFNTMEFVVRALRGWAVPMVIPIPQAWQAFDEQGKARDPSTDQQLRALGKEVVRAASQFKMQGYCDYSLQETATQSQSD